MWNARSGAGAHDPQAGGRDRGDPIPRTPKAQGSDAFAAQRDAWLGQIASDGNLPGSAVRVAVVIALHLNREQGCAWPSSETIRAKTALSNGAIHNAINALIVGGHLRPETADPRLVVSGRGPIAVGRGGQYRTFTRATSEILPHGEARA